MAAKYGVHDVPGEHQIQVYIPSQTGSTTDSWPLLVASFGALKLVGASFTPSAEITNNNTNYFSFAIQNAGTDGSGSTAMTSTLSFTVTALGATEPAFVPTAFTVSATEANLAAAQNEVIKLVRTVAASGLTNPDGILTLRYIVK